jgi:quinol monooxygenase YgiN
MAKVSVLAKFTAKEGKADGMAAAFDDLFKAAAAESGTEIYVMNRSSSDPNVFFFYELYADADALGAHGGSEAMQKAAAVFGPMIAESELIIGEPLKAEGVQI